MKRICTSSVGCPTADERCDAPLQQRDVVLQPRQGVTNKTVEDLCAVLSLVFSLHWIQGDHYLLPGQQPGQTTPSVPTCTAHFGTCKVGEGGYTVPHRHCAVGDSPQHRDGDGEHAPSIALTIDTVPESESHSAVSSARRLYRAPPNVVSSARHVSINI